MRVRQRHLHGVTLLIALILAVLVTVRPDWLKSNLKTAEQNQPGLYSIHNFVDGDTIAVNMNGYTETVRMIGVDTPETHRPNTPLQCFGNEASNYTKQLIGSHQVRLQADPLDTNRDRYGRLLRYVYLPDGTLVENKLIGQGYGFAYTQFPFEKTDEFKSLQQQAKDAMRGLWGACQVTVEANGRQQTNAAN